MNIQDVIARAHEESRLSQLTRNYRSAKDFIPAGHNPNNYIRVDLFIERMIQSFIYTGKNSKKEQRVADWFQSWVDTVVYRALVQKEVKGCVYPRIEGRAVMSNYRYISYDDIHVLLWALINLGVFSENGKLSLYQRLLKLEKLSLYQRFLKLKKGVVGPYNVTHTSFTHNDIIYLLDKMGFSSLLSIHSEAPPVYRIEYRKVDIDHTKIRYNMSLSTNGSAASMYISEGNSLLHLLEALFAGIVYLKHAEGDTRVKDKPSKKNSVKTIDSKELIAPTEENMTNSIVDTPEENVVAPEQERRFTPKESVVGLYRELTLLIADLELDQLEGEDMQKVFKRLGEYRQSMYFVIHQIKNV